MSALFWVGVQVDMLLLIRPSGRLKIQLDNESLGLLEGVNKVGGGGQQEWMHGRHGAIEIHVQVERHL